MEIQSIVYSHKNTHIQLRNGLIQKLKPADITLLPTERYQETII